MAEACAKTRSAPITKIIMRIGASQYFFLCRKNDQNSARNSIFTFPSRIDSTSSRERAREAVGSANKSCFLDRSRGAKDPCRAGATAHRSGRRQYKKAKPS